MKNQRSAGSRSPRNSGSQSRPFSRSNSKSNETSRRNSARSDESPRRSSNPRSDESSRRSSSSRSDQAPRSGSNSRSQNYSRQNSNSKPFTRSYEKPSSEDKSNNSNIDKKFGKKGSRNFFKDKFSREPAPMFMWGKRIVEAFLTQCQARRDFDPSLYSLHIVVDKAGKAPSQLKTAYDLAKQLGIKISSHKSEEDEWPLGFSENDKLNHQRICLRIPEYPASSIEDLLARFETLKQNKCVGLILDQVQDPRNFGALLRSAAFFGLDFVIYGTDRQTEVNALVLKTSAGGAFHVNLIPVVNINRAMKQLKDAGAWMLGAALDEKSVSLNKVPLDRPWVLVVGNEGKGLRQDIKSNCDMMVKIPGGIETVDSLNVSVATGILINGLCS